MKHYIDFQAKIFELNQQIEELERQASVAWLEDGSLDRADALYSKAKNLKFKISHLEMERDWLFKTKRGLR